jgi:DNA (cytosine-5)-methyltransferase 1
MEAIRIVKPREVLLENVPGILGNLPYIIRDMRRSGYTVKRPERISAAAVGAGHLRRRVWIYAHDDKAGRSNIGRESATETETVKRDTVGVGNREAVVRLPWFETEPDLDRVVHGLANGVDRLEALGNGQVPAVVAAAWRLLTNGDAK